MHFPVLDKLDRLAARHTTINFSNVVLIAIQHILPTNGSLLEVLNKLGLRYDQMHVLGKVYSTSEGVYEELDRRGVHIHPDSLTIDKVTLSEDYKRYLDGVVENLLDDVIEKLDKLDTDKMLLVVDDGGQLIRAVSKYTRRINARIVAVEQTRSGAELLRGLQLTFPVINVAESRKKLLDESPYIAAAIIEQIASRQDTIRFSLEDRNVLIVGDGAIGSQVIEQLRDVTKSVSVYDTGKVTPTAQPHYSDLPHALAGKGLIIGCTGKSWVPTNYKELLGDGVVLASGSSSNTELLGVQLRAHDILRPRVTFSHKDIMQSHSDYRISLNNGTGWILNGGFPVNFNGLDDAIPSEDIELTRILMLRGILQAMSTATVSGLIDMTT
jgi:S-adenosylhomocysteine hydrolase